MAKYKMFFAESEFQKMAEKEGQELVAMVEDGETLAQFQAKVVLSRAPKEGYSDVMIMSDRGRVSGENWYINIIERMEADEEVTVFESMRLGDRRGYMLRSMMAEDKSKMKKETMGTELEKRLKRKQEILKGILDRPDAEKPPE